MDITALNSQTRVTELTFDQVAREASLPATDQANDVGQQFEAVLLRQILNDATKNLFSTEESNATTSGIYQDMVTNSLAESMTRSGGLGLSKVLAKQLRIESNSTPSPTPAA